VNFTTFPLFLSWAGQKLGKGPHAIVLCEDESEIASTVEHTLTCGFRKVIVIGENLPDLSKNPQVVTVDHRFSNQREAVDLVNQIIPVATGQWLYYCFNAEYLFFPFFETRTVGEMLVFCTEERRESVLTFTVDLYARYLWDDKDAINRDDAYFDRSGYFATSRKDEWGNDLDRQLDFFGGLRSRFEEHVPAARRKIDRVSIFKAKKGLTLNADHTINDPEYNTFACPWHNSPTASIASFRTAKALKRNPSSTFEIESFYWHGSAPFTWKSQQLMEAGLMEPGQWY